MGFGAGSGAGAGLCFDTATCLQQFWYSSQKLVPFAQDIILILPLSQIAYIVRSETALNCPLAMSSPYQSHVMGFGVGEGFGCGAGDGLGAGLLDIASGFHGIGLGVGPGTGFGAGL